jgi:hypothetical protein
VNTVPCFAQACPWFVPTSLDPKSFTCAGGTSVAGTGTVANEGGTFSKGAEVCEQCFESENRGKIRGGGKLTSRLSAHFRVHFYAEC